MKTEYSIYLDYKQAIQQAEVLYEAARLLKSEADNMSNSRDAVIAAWNGPAADVYIKKLDNEERDLRKTASRVRYAADTVKKIAVITYRSEKQALEIAKARTYK